MSDRVVVDFTPSGKPVRHGKVGAYRNHKCRCNPCTAEHAASIAKDRAERRKHPIPNFVVHGKADTYSNWGCRCKACTADHARKRREQYQRSGT